MNRRCDRHRRTAYPTTGELGHRRAAVVAAGASAVGWHAQSAQRWAWRTHFRAATPVAGSSGTCHTAFSLLEVILALAILAGAIAALGEVMRLGDQNAGLARDESEAEMLANSVMSELVAGSRQVQAVSSETFDTSASPAWTYSITVDSTDYDALVAVRVSVAQQLAAELHPARCDLVRWLPNPDYTPPNADQQSTTTDSSSGSNSSSNRSSNSGSSSSGSR